MRTMTMILAMAVTLLAASAFAAEWTGHISDSKCGAGHSDHSQKSVDCVKACVKGGQKPVFVTEDKKVLKISNPDKVMDHLGHQVTLTGTLAADTITVESVKHVAAP